MRKSHIPALVVLACLVFCHGVLSLYQITRQQDLYFVNKITFGLDHTHARDGSNAVTMDANPYRGNFFCWPPFYALLIGVPLTHLSFASASMTISLANLAAVLLSFGLMQWRYGLAGGRSGLTLFFLGFLIVSHSYPFFFLFDRSNIDGLVLLFVSAAICFVGKIELAGGLFLAGAIGLKVYPVLLLLPLIIQRRWRILIWTGLWMLVFFLLAPGMWLEYVSQRVLSRSEEFRVAENGSLPGTFYQIGLLFQRVFPQLIFDEHLETLKSFALVVWTVCLAAAAYCDYMLVRLLDNNKTEYLCLQLMLYFPFMVALPFLAYHYELVVLIALLPALGWSWRRTCDPAARIILMLITISIFFSQVQVVAMEKLSESSAPNIIPGLSLFVLLLAVVAYKYCQWLAMKNGKTINHAVL